jgi:hypothetical protein
METWRSKIVPAATVALPEELPDQIMKRKSAGVEPMEAEVRTGLRMELSTATPKGN